MNLSHYSARPITQLYKKVERDEKYFKPTGLWVSVDGEHDWRAWCEAENFRLECLRIKYSVKLKPTANILHLSTAVELETFTKEYSVRGLAGSDLNCHIDWPRLRGQYDGIIISPYQWSQRMELMWYYSWDCASGCVWNIEQIESMIPDWLHTVKHGLRLTYQGLLHSLEMKRFLRAIRNR